MNFLLGRKYISKKRSFRLVASLCLWLAMSAFSMAASYVAADDSRFQLLGTWKGWDNTFYTIYPGSTIRIKIEGTAWVDLADYNYDAPRVRVRRLGQNGGTIYDSNQTLMLTANNGPVEYEIVFIAIQGVSYSPSQHAYSGTSLYFKGVWLAAGATLYHASPPNGGIRLEFLGDSITHGVRILRNYGSNLFSQDASQCYGYYLSRALHSPYRIRGHSGESLGNIAGKVRYFRENSLLTPTPEPNYVFINMGANDKSHDNGWFYEQMRGLLRRVHIEYPNAHVFVLDFFSQNPSRVSTIKSVITHEASSYAEYFNAYKYIHRFTDGIHPDGISQHNLAVALAAKMGPSPHLLSPLHNIVESKRPALYWRHLPEAESFKIIVKHNGKSYLTKYVGATTNMVFDKDLPSGNYEWWVQARNSYADLRWSGRGEFKVLPYKPDVPATQIEPSGVVDLNRNPKFEWDAVDRATDYHIWINRNDKTYHDKWIKGTSYKINDKGLPGGTYKWWIQSYNADGYGPWTDKMEFIIPTNVPDKVDIVAPMGIHNGSSIVYQWNADGKATWYELLVHKDGKKYHAPYWFNTGITNGIVSEEINHANFGEYNWWMRGWSPDGYGKWSDKGMFSYGLSIPLRPSGIIPTGGSHQFVWTGVDDIPWYQLWIHKDKKYYKDIWVQSTNWVFASRLPYGDYGFWVRSWKNNEFGPWSDDGNFKIGAASPLFPSGELFSPPTELRWDNAASRDAKWYQVIIHWGKNPFFDEWIKVEDTIDYGGDVRGITNLPTFMPPFGTYTTWVRAWTDDNMGPWSDGLPFTVSHR